MPEHHTPRRSNTLAAHVQPLFYGSFAESHIDLRLKTPSSAPSPIHVSPVKQRPPPLRAATTQPTRADPPSRPTKSRASSLFNLFSRPKAEKARGYHEALPPPPRPRSPPTLSVPERPSTRLSIRSPTPQPQPQTPREYVQPPPIPERSPSGASIRSTKSSKSVKINRAKSDNDVTGHRLDSAWEPPPLFQAYPQAVKHTVLAVPDLMDGKSGQENRAKTNRLSGFFSRNTTRVEPPPPRAKLRKIFMLTTSGYMLQYAHDGPSDRLPERVLRLGRHSVAFASDLIPGKPFVLEVLQIADNAVHVETPEKSFLSKFGRQSSGVSQMVASLLLIFEQPEQMNDWMISVRREIELLGGKKFSRTTNVRPQPDNSDTMSISSQRYRGLQRTLSMKSGRSIKAPSVTSIPSLPVSSQLHSPIVSFESSANTAHTSTGSEWSSSTSAFGPSHRSSEGTTYGEAPVTPATTPGDERTASLLSRYNTKLSPRAAIPLTPELNMHDLLTPEATPSPYPLDDMSYDHQAMFTKYDIVESPTSSPILRSRSRVGEAFQPTTQPRTPIQPTSLARGYRGWSTNPASKHPPMPPMPVSASPTTPTIEINGMNVLYHAPPRSRSQLSNYAEISASDARPRPPPRAVSQLSNHVEIPASEQQTRSVRSRPPPDIPLYRQQSSPTLPHALLAGPFVTSPALPVRRQRPTSNIRNSSSPIPLRTSQLHLTSPLSLPRSRSPSPLLSPTLPEQNPLRRPASLPIHSDPAPFLASIRPGGLAGSNSPSYRLLSSNHAADLRRKQQQRASIQVPIIRPGTIKNRNEELKGLKSRKSAPLLPLLTIPPGPPPSKALPEVPMAQ